MNRWAPLFFRQLAEQAGMPEEQIEAIRAHYEHAHNIGVAPVISLRHLALSCGVEYRHLRSRCARRPFTVMNGTKSKPYQTFAIRKRSGGKRIISVPANDILQVQRWINRNILSKQKCHSRAFAYQQKKSIADCAAIHLSCRWLIKLDISNFFESITERHVYQVFHKIGYPRLVAFEMARLCTRIDKQSKTRQNGTKWRSNRKLDIVAISDYSYPIIGYLPQGAPTSPVLSNLVAFSLDVSLFSLATTMNVEYSRYSDDIYFSTQSLSFKKEDAIDLVRQATTIISRHDFDLNRSKTAIAGPGHRRLVLSILVDGNKLKLSKQFRRNLEWHYRNCLSDPATHATQKRFNSVLGLKNYLNGLISFAQDIDPEYVSRLKQHIINWPV